MPYVNLQDSQRGPGNPGAQSQENSFTPFTHVLPDGHGLLEHSLRSAMDICTLRIMTLVLNHMESAFKFS